MKKLFLLTVSLILSIMASAQTHITLTVGDRTLSATLTDNPATRELLSLLAREPITVDMNDYGGFEKVGALPQSLPSSDSQIIAQPGDIMLYQGRNLVIFYGPNSWSYTRLGKIDNATAQCVCQFLGERNVSLRLSLAPPSGIEEVNADVAGSGKVYDLQGNLISARPLRSGIYIINGCKVLIR